jgi:PhoPQ-activated pathogenicity-related protein
MTSQSWREGDVTPHLWKHWVTIVVPEGAAYDKALLVVSGGNNKHDRPPRSVDGVLAMVATTTRSVLVELQGVPSEPVQFSDETRTRTEDEIIAYTFDKYLTTGDPTWPLLCPMVKSAVRAMDATQEFCKNRISPSVDLNAFVVTGASKRGWTSWLTAAVDERVVAVAPIVIDMLNLDEQMKRQYSYYQSYSEAIQDYTDFNIQQRVDTPEGRELLKIVDPYEYRDVLTMPKFVLLGSGDQYWTVDAADLYFVGLKGEKYIRYEPNADHGIDNSRASIMALVAFYNSILTDTPMPRFTWTIRPDGSFTVKAADQPLEVRIWMAHAPTKDFRLMTIGEAWYTEILPPTGDGVYKGQVPAPEQGHTAFFVELVYPGTLGFDYSLTTVAAIPGPAKSPLSLAILALPVVLLVGAGVFMLRRS